MFAGVSGARRVVLKVSPASHRSVGMLRSEREFVRHLAAAGVPVAAPLTSRAGHDVETLAGAGGESHHAHVSEHVPGRLMAPSSWTTTRFERWGRLMGAVHTLAKEFRPANTGFTRPDWHSEMTAEFEEIDSGTPELRAKGLSVIERLNRLEKSTDTFGLIHGDLHQWNVMWTGDIPRPVDFDNTAWDWFAADISVVLHNVLSAQAHARNASEWAGGGRMDRASFVRFFLGHFMHDYERENRLDRAQLRALPDLMRRRHLSVFLDRTRNRELAAQTEQEQASQMPWVSISTHHDQVLHDEWQDEGFDWL